MKQLILSACKGNSITTKIKFYNKSMTHKYVLVDERALNQTVLGKIINERTFHPIKLLTPRNYNMHTYERSFTCSDKVYLLTDEEAHLLMI